MMYFAVPLLFLALLTSCSVVRFFSYASSSTPSRGELRGNTFYSPSVVYEIGELSPSWTRIKVEGGDMAFYNKEKVATITVNSSCRRGDVPYSLKALSESLTIGIRKKEELSRAVITVDDMPAMRVHLKGELDGEPIEMCTVVLKKEGCIFDFSYSSSPANFASGVSDFDEFVLMFRMIQRK